MSKVQILYLLLLPITLFAQLNTSLSGLVVEKETGKVLPFAQIVLTMPENPVIIVGDLSDENGRFTLSGMKSGNYTLTCSFIGYKTNKVPVFIGTKNNIYNIGTIALEAQVLEGESVFVEAKRSIVSEGLDKKTFSAEELFNQSGGSVLEAMKSLPGVTVNQEGKVLLRGSDKVAVLMDGEQSSLTGFGNQKSLDNIPVSNIERMEIINNPSAKYDASGMAGIINIINKKEKRSGLNGEAGFSWGLGVLSTRKDDLPTPLGSYSKNPIYAPSLNLNYRKNDINVFLQSEVIDQKRLPNNEFTTRIYKNGEKIVSQVPENRSQTHYIFSGGMDWKLNDQDLLTVSSIFDYEGHIDTAQVPYINLNSNTRNRLWHWNEDEVTGYVNYRVNYKHQYQERGHELNATLQYTRGWEDEQYFLNDSSYVRESVDNTHIDATEHVTTASLDYVKPTRRGRMESGIKTQIRSIPVTYVTIKGVNSIIYPGLGDWSDWGENIYSGYLNYIYERPRYAIEAGFRVEQTNVYYEISPENIYYNQNDKYDYLELFPNVRLSYRMNSDNNISVFFNRRVDRPDEATLRIFPKYDDPELLKVGNPYLRPQFTRTMELAYEHSWQRGSFFLSGYYRLIDDPFTRVYSIDESNDEYDIINKIYQNVGSGSNSGVELLLSQQIKKNLKINGSYNYYNNIIDAYSGELLFPYPREFNIQKTTDLTWDMKLSGLLTPANGWQVQLVYIYYAPKNIPQGRQLSRSSLDLAVKKSVLANRAELAFSFTDILNQNGIRQELHEDTFDAVYENYYDTQVMRLGFKYKF